MPIFAYADSYLPNWEGFISRVSDDLPKLSWNDWIEKLNNLAKDTIIPITKFIFVSISILFIIINLFKLVWAWWEEDKIWNFKEKMWYIILWFIVIWLSDKIAHVFNPLVWNNTHEFYSVTWLRAVFVSIWNFIKIFAW